VLALTQAINSTYPDISFNEYVRTSKCVASSIPSLSRENGKSFAHSIKPSIITPDLRDLGMVLACMST